MFIALNSIGERVGAAEAIIGKDYYCPICGEEVLLRNGQIREMHFSHKAGVCTDAWHYDMSEWHRHKQSFFPIECQEVVVVNEGIKHRADVLIDDIVIEFQHSPISVKEFCDRNDFYTAIGLKVVWVFDVDEQWKSGTLYFNDAADNQWAMKWKNPKKVLQYGPSPNDASKDIVVWLAWDDSESPDSLYKVIWSSQNYDFAPDYKNIEISSRIIDMYIGMDAKELLYTETDWLKKHLKSNKPYAIKHSGEKGHLPIDYTCPVTNVFISKVFGARCCSYCKHCTAIAEISGEKKNRHRVYCCYPRQVREADNAPEGYEYGGVEIYRIVL